jgi:N-acetylmuramoyl-L-alanine amidase
LFSKGNPVNKYFLVAVCIGVLSGCTVPGNARLGAAGSGLETEMISAAEFARALGAPPLEADHASGRYSTVLAGVKVTLCTGMAIALVNETLVDLPSRVVMGGDGPTVPREAVTLIRRALPAHVPAERNCTVVIDPGHGGCYDGGKGFGLLEKDVVLHISLELAKYLRSRGFKVSLTRTTGGQLSENYNEDLNLRPHLANRLGADLFVSVHANEFRDPDAQGFEVFWSPLRNAGGLAERMLAYPVPARFLGKRTLPAARADRLRLWRSILTKKDAASRRLAECIIDALEESVDDTNRGVKESQLRVTRLTFCPSVLVEVGFLSHRPTAEKLRKSSYRRKMAHIIGKGIEKYWEEVRGGARR